MSQYIYQRTGAKYEIKKITPKLVFYCTPRGDCHTVPRNKIKSDAACSLRWDWYWEPPSWPTEGPLSEMYAELRELEKAKVIARAAYEKAYSRWGAMRNQIYQRENEEEQRATFVAQEQEGMHQ
jgi:hypothetical protein